MELLGFSSLKYCRSMLLPVQCLKTVASYTYQLPVMDTFPVTFIPETLKVEIFSLTLQQRKLVKYIIVSSVVLIIFVTML